MEKLELSEVRKKLTFALEEAGETNIELNNKNNFMELFTSTDTDKYIVRAICFNPSECRYVDLDYPGQRQVVPILVRGLREMELDVESAVVHCSKVMENFGADDESFIRESFSKENVPGEDILTYAVNMFFKKKIMRDKLINNDMSFMNYAFIKHDKQNSEIAIGITPSDKFKWIKPEKLLEEIRISADDFYERNSPHLVTDADCGPIDGFWGDYIATETVAEICGASKAGKSTFALNLALHIQNGEVFMGEPVKKGRVLYADFENGKKTAANRRKDIRDKLGFAEDIDLITSDDFEAVKSFIKRKKREGQKYDVLIFDNFYSMFDGIDENNNTEVGNFLKNNFNPLKEEYAIAYVHHPNKTTSKTKVKGEQDVTDYGGGAGVHGKYADCFIIIEKVSDLQALCYVHGRNIPKLVRIEMEKNGFIFTPKPFSGMTNIPNVEVTDYLNTHYPCTWDKAVNGDGPYTLRGLNADLKRKGDIYKEFMRDQDKITKKIGEEPLGAREIRIIGFLYDPNTKHIGIPGHELF